MFIGPQLRQGGDGGTGQTQRLEEFDDLISTLCFQVRNEFTVEQGRVGHEVHHLVDPLQFEHRDEPGHLQHPLHLVFLGQHQPDEAVGALVASDGCARPGIAVAHALQHGAVVGVPQKGELMQGDQGLVVTHLDLLSTGTPLARDQGSHRGDERHRAGGVMHQVRNALQGLASRVAGETKMAADCSVDQIGRSPSGVGPAVTEGCHPHTDLVGMRDIGLGVQRLCLGRDDDDVGSLEQCRCVLGTQPAGWHRPL